MPTKKLPKELAIGASAVRFMRADVAAEPVDLEARTVTLAFSSETPVERYFGNEILDHNARSIRTDRLRSGGPLLMDHNPTDQVGVIESVQIGADKVARAVVRFGRSARAAEVMQDVADRIRGNVSVGYQIHAAVLDSSKDGAETYRVTDWEPYEISLVSVPADASVGVGRSAAQPSKPSGDTPMSEQNNNAAAAASDPAAIAAATATATAEGQRSGAAVERKRVDDIIAIGEQYQKYGVDKIAGEAIRSGLSVDAFRAKAMEKLSSGPLPNADIGLDKKEVKQYSLMRALNYLANPSDQRARESAKFEIECSLAAADKSGKAARGLVIPYDVLKRDLNKTTNTAGGYTVETELLAGNFIDLLRNRMVIDSLGAQMLTGLVGNIAIPRATGAASAYWIAESGSPTESQPAFDQVTMSPKTVGAYTDISRKLLLQSSIDVESFVQADIATVLALAIQSAAIIGGGSNEPVGILGTSGIGDVAGGANGLAPTWADIVNLETLIASANADVGTLGYLTNAKVRGALKQTSKMSNTIAQAIWGDGNTPVNGYKAAVTNGVPSNLDKGTSTGVCSAIIFGNFADLIIGMWGGLDLMVDPYTGSTSGTVRIVALQDVDIAVRHALSFSAMKDALTA